MIYRRGTIWWYKFEFCGVEYRESTKSSNKTLARAAERKRHQQLEESYNGVTLARATPKLFLVAAKDHLALKQAKLTPKSLKIERINLTHHLVPAFGPKLLTEITAVAIGAYITERREAGAAEKTIKNELATLRAILRRAKLWEALVDDVPTLRERDDVGVVVSAEEEQRLLAACQASRSRALYTVAVVGFNTGLRDDEIRRLRWRQLDLERRFLTVGLSKTLAGTGRVLPLNGRLLVALRIWANHTPTHLPMHYMFPREQYGKRSARHAGIYGADPTKPMGRFVKAWTTARRLAGVTCRFHDLRHTFCTRTLEQGTPFAVLADVMGWSPGQTVKMAKRYGHINNAARRAAVEAVDPTATPPRGGTQSGTLVEGQDSVKAVNA